MSRIYKVLKNTPTAKAGNLLFKVNADPCCSSYENRSQGNENRFRYISKEEVENNPEWYELLADKITCLVVGDAMKFDNGTFMTATLTLSSPIPNEKMGDIRKAIEEVVNDKKQ